MLPPRAGAEGAASGHGVVALLRAIGASFAEVCAADSLQRFRHREFYSSELRDELILLGGVDGGGLVRSLSARCAAADGRCDPAAPPLRYMLGEFEDHGAAPLGATTTSSRGAPNDAGRAA